MLGGGPLNKHFCAQNLLNLNLGKKGVHIGHINIQGLQNKLEQIF